MLLRIELPIYKTAKPKKEITLNDIDRYLNIKTEQWVKVLLLILWMYGIRIGEALALKAFDVWSDGEYLWLNSTPEKNPDKPRRVLPVKADSPHVSLILSYVNSLDQTRLLFPYSSMWAWTKLKEIDETLCAHRFRHNRATNIALTRAHPYELQSWLGHKSIRSSEVYIHASGVFAEDLGKRMVIR